MKASPLMSEQPNEPNKAADAEAPHTQPVTVKQSDHPKPRPAFDPAALLGPDPETIDHAIAQAPTLEEKIRAAVRQVYDPEIPVNIDELGLIYDISVDEQNNVHVLMTLTSPACPAAQELPLNVRRNVSRIAQVNDVEVEITFDPPWSPERMSEVAKLQLGFL